MSFWPELPGTFTVHVSGQSADFWARNETAVLVEQDASPFGRYAGWLPLPRRLLDELTEEELRTLIRNGLDHIFRPWRYPDRPAFPEFDLFPRAARLWRWLRR